jgi:pimeloyl-ACP methyl ester carboxylesterase
MTATGAAEIRAAVDGREALEGYLASHEFDMEQFTPADQAALQGHWAWLARIAGLAMKGDGEVGGGPDGYIDDQLGDVRPWGFEPGQVTVPVLVFHGGQDRMVPSEHGAWLAARCPDAELWLRPDDGHVSVLGSCGVAALDWPSARYDDEGRWTSEAELSALRRQVGAQHRMLSSYLNAFRRHGLWLDELREPVPASQ